MNSEYIIQEDFNRTWALSWQLWPPMDWDPLHESSGTLGQQLAMTCFSGFGQ